MRCMNASYEARLAPAVERAMMKRTPTSRANGSSSVRPLSGLPLDVATRSKSSMTTYTVGPCHQLRSRSCCGVTSAVGVRRFIRSARATMWWSMAFDIGMYSARWESGVTPSRERRLSTTNSLHSSPE